MPVLPVHVHAGGETIPATLTTEHAASSYGRPVLLLEGGPSHPEGEPVPYGPGDVTRWGVAAELRVTMVDREGPEGDRLLQTWERMAAAYLRRQGGPVDRYTIRPEGGTSWATAPTLPQARRLAREARDRGLRRVQIVDESTGETVAPGEA